jgi:hypothetical protein
MFVPGKPFQPSLMFVGESGEWSASLGLAPALPANIRLGWKGLPVTNAVAYYDNP